MPGKELREFIGVHIPHPPRQQEEVLPWAKDLCNSLDAAFRNIADLFMPHTGKARVSQQLLADGFKLDADGLLVLVSSAGAVTSDATTPIAHGSAGMTLFIINVGAQNITFKDATTCSLGADITLGTDDTIIVSWDNVNSRWVRMASANN